MDFVSVHMQFQVVHHMISTIPITRMTLGRNGSVDVTEDAGLLGQIAADRGPIVTRTSAILIQKNVRTAGGT